MSILARKKQLARLEKTEERLTWRFGANTSADGGVRMRSWRKLGACGLALLISGSAIASETITYTYDAKGRLIKVVRSGSVNNGVTTDYTSDRADNRRNVKTTGSSNPPPP